MKDENRNLFIALFLCLLVLLGWPYLMHRPQEPVGQSASSTSASHSRSAATSGDFAPKDQISQSKPSGASAVSSSRSPSSMPQAEEAARIRIQTPSLLGSFSLVGGRLDDLSLTQYHVKADAKSPLVWVFVPHGQHPQVQNLAYAAQERPGPYFGEFGWLPVQTDANLRLPDWQTKWSVDTEKMGASTKEVVLTPERPVHLIWDNGSGLIFRRCISVDRNYLFTIQDSVTNRGNKPVGLYSYGLIVRQTQADEGSHILHEGLIGAFKSTGLKEMGYSALKKQGSETVKDTQGWLGVTDKYWASALIPEQGKPMTAQFKNHAEANVVQVDYMSEPLELSSGASISYTHRLFAGAKIVSLINGYQDSMDIYRFDLMMDWGWFSFLTKPVFYMIDGIGKVVKNFGVAILVMTVLVKALFYPLAKKSYVSMNKMKQLTPSVERIRETHKGDMAKQQQEIMALYRREGVNPVSGCLPLLIQIPVFFALYKVLYGTIEMRHAPFFGWIHDLSAPDPTSIFNLFGLLPWSLPSYLVIGVWPLLLGLSMFFQQRLTPGVSDPVQRKVLMWLPVVFTFMLAQFPAGLVIYWTWNNLLSILQQVFISYGATSEGGWRSLLPMGKK